MVLKIREAVLNEIIAHALETYPEECCGLLIEQVDRRGEVLEAVRMRNSYPGQRLNRYSIDPMELYRMDRLIAQRGGIIVGIYHSHPDHPPIPSQFDFEHAWPGISYLVISVSKGEFREAKSWFLDEDRTGFINEGLSII